MGTRVVAVSKMFGNFARLGSLRTAYLRSAPEGISGNEQNTTVRTSLGFTDYIGPLSDKSSTRSRMITGVAQRRRIDYIVQVQMHQDDSAPIPNLEVYAQLFRRPFDSMRMPVHGKEKVIRIMNISLKVRKEDTVSRYLGERMTPEKIFMMLARRNEQFLELVRRFNRYSARS